MSVTHHPRHPSQPSDCVPISGPACHLALHCIPCSGRPGSVGRGLKAPHKGKNPTSVDVQHPRCNLLCHVASEAAWTDGGGCRLVECSCSVTPSMVLQADVPCMLPSFGTSTGGHLRAKGGLLPSRWHDYVITPGRSKMTTPRLSVDADTRHLLPQKKKDISPGGSRVRRNVPA